MNKDHTTRTTIIDHAIIVAVRRILLNGNLHFRWIIVPIVAPEVGNINRLPLFIGV